MEISFVIFKLNDIMKMKYLFLGMLTSLVALTGCKDPDDLVRTDTENVTTLSVKGMLVSDEKTEYDAVVDKAAGTITVQVPYYLSDTEPVQGDLTKMKVTATLPVGAKFEPSIQGIHNLVEGFNATLVEENGTRTPYRFLATMKKSSAASITKVVLEDMPNATIRVSEPEAEGGKGKIVIYKTSSSLDGALKQATLTASPWATVKSAALDPSTGIIDLSQTPEITVVAQDGNQVAYETSIELPTIKPSGIGYTAVLFGIQMYKDNEYGFEEGANRTMAVVGDYLIISNSNDYTKMVVLNRFNGKPVNVKVNTTGIDAGRSIHAITTDDAGHLVAVAYTSTVEATQTDPNVRAWVWANGINQAPKSIVWTNINGGTFTNAPMGVNGVKNLDLGRTLTVKGDLTKGDAIMAMASHQTYRPVFLKFKDGVMQSPAQVEWAGGTVSMWKSTKVIALSNTEPFSYIWCTGNYHSAIMYVPEGTGTRATTFTKPTSHWWNGSGTYDKTVRGIGYIEFNGCHLLGAQNGWSSSGTWYFRLYVSDITAAPNEGSLAGGFLFDSREGSSAGTGAIPGTGYGVNGMTSAYPYVSGKTILGSNADETGDVVFGKSDDGNAVQVYMLTTDQGLIAYEMTRFDL